MDETDRSRVDVDEIMNNIRDEIARRKREEKEREASEGKRRGPFSPGPGLIRGGAGAPAGEGGRSFQKKERYCLKDFLDHHDRDFIIHAYRGILKRSADADGGEHFLNALRSGDLTKIEVLGRLRYSPEGREKGAPVQGLFFAFAVQTSFRIPVLGYVSRLFTGVAQLPRIIKNIQSLDSHVHLQAALFDETLHGMAREFENRANETVRAMDGKADKVETTALLARKADRAELEADRAGLEAIRGRVNEILAEIRDHKRHILDQQRRLARFLDEAGKRLPDALHAERIATLRSEEDHLLDAMYVSFEDRFRGARGDIKERLREYLPHIEAAGAGAADALIVDVGCGRGEWLELCTENRLAARGVDLNRVMVAMCRERGYDAVEADAITALGEMEADSLGAVTGFHIVEHLPPRTLIRLLDEAMRALKPGGLAIFETPNPENLITGACNFYMDFTHRNPIPPPALQYLMEARGYVDVRVLRLHENASSRLTVEDDRLHSLLFGPQDYAVIAGKPI